MSLIKKDSGVLVSTSVTGAVGKGMVVAGAGGLGLWFIAGLLPFISLPMLLIIMVVAGIFIAE